MKNQLIMESDEGGNHDGNDEDYAKIEASLRKLVEERPKNAKAMYQLATLLVEQSVKQKGDDDDIDDHDDEEVEQDCAAGVTDKLRAEAISISKHAIKVQPLKPFGYAAFSISSYDFEERMEYAKKAVDMIYEDKSNIKQYKIALVILLVRLLIEPRQKELKKVRGQIGKGSTSHPSKRQLNGEENLLYKQIQSTLSTFWENDLEVTESQKRLVCYQEYKLGLFFRKKLPADTNQKRAIHHFQRSQIVKMADSRNTEMAQFWIATMQDDKAIIEKCPSHYIVGLYSTFAERFDDLLVEKLNYQTPTKLRILFDEYHQNQSKPTKIESCLDLGCGTGLSGIAFQDLVVSSGKGRIDGVDLSPEMIEKARKLRSTCYTNLYVGDVATILEQKYATKSLDMILACDVFCYIGNLSPIFESVSEKLADKGYFCFSTELLVVSNSEDISDVPPYRLHDCARFVHQRKYIEELATSNNFEILKISIQPIRKNQGKDVQGILALLRLR